MEIRANLVVGSNGAMTVGGSSKGLSLSSDRQRFHEIRTWADAILIGGSTSRTEPYGATPTPLYIWSRQAALSSPAAQNPLAHLVVGTIESVLSGIESGGCHNLLCEGGPALVSALVEINRLDGIYLTQSSQRGDGDFINLDLLLADFQEVDRSLSGDEIFRYLERNEGNS